MYLNNELVGSYKVDLINWPDITPNKINIPIKIKPGENILKFYTPQEGTVPLNVNAWADQRLLSLAFQNISLGQTT